MKYFIDGLSKEELKKEYKALAKKYHPDICKDENANAIMAAINEEYDEYFSSLTPNINTMHWTPPTKKTSTEKTYEKRKRPTGRSIVWMSKTDTFRWRYQAVDETGRWYYETFVSNDDESWKGFNGGPCIVEYDIYFCSPRLVRSCRRVKQDLKMPSFDQIIEMVYNDRKFTGFRFSIDDFKDNSWNRRFINLYYHVRKDNEEYLIIGKANYNNIINGVPEAAINDGVVDVIFSVGSDLMTLRNTINIFSSYEVVDVYYDLDFAFLKYTGYRANQFVDFYDLDDFPEFFTEKVDPDNISDRTAHFYAKHDIVRFRSMKNHQDIRFGCFNIDALVRNLPNIDMKDIDDIQDYLDIVNGESDKKIRAMIKKGKIGIKI